jgi:hypothetical protein
VSKRDEVTGESRKLHNEELNNPYSSPSIFRAVNSRRMRWAGHVARMGEGRDVHRVLMGNSDGRRSLGLRLQFYVILMMGAESTRNT